MAATAATEGGDKFRFGVHPSYLQHQTDWESMDDAYEGERRVKDKSNGVKYLPFTPSQRLDGVDNSTQDGWKDYAAYKMRATFPDYVTDAVETLVGLLHSKPAEIKVPDAMKPLLESCTKSGTSIYGLLKIINELQLCPGRCGILVDIDETTRLPYFSVYYAEDIVNWTDDQNVCDYVVLDESGETLDKQTGLWEAKTKHRVVKLDSGEFKVASIDADSDIVSADFTTPKLNGKILKELGFVFVNSRDLNPEPDRAPLLGLARICYTIYRGEADYRQNLFMQGQDTLVVIDANTGEGEAPTRVGAGAKINVNIGGDAKYIGVDSQGLAEQRQAIENDRMQARARAGHFIASGQASQESGDALRTRLAALTATLNTVASTGGEAIAKILGFAADFMGVDKKEIVVTPNTEFFDIQLLGQDLELYMRSIAEGAPLSPESVHNLLKKRGVAMFDFEEEVKRRDKQYTPPVAKPAAPAAPSATAPAVVPSTK